MEEKAILKSFDQGLATITINRPQVLGALDLASAEELVQALQLCAADDEVEAVILTGTGAGFCAGGDLKAVWDHIQAGGDSREFFLEITQFANRAVMGIRHMEKLVLAAVNGVASGMGMSLALACDIRMAGESARFKQGFTSLGLVPDAGWTVFMPEIIGSAKTMEMLLIDPVVGAKQALSLGLFSDVVPDEALLERARQVARRLIGEAKSSLIGSKALINESLFPNLEAQMERERQRIVFQAGTPEFRERLAAFLGNQTPELPPSTWEA